MIETNYHTGNNLLHFPSDSLFSCSIKLSLRKVKNEVLHLMKHQITNSRNGGFCFHKSAQHFICELIYPEVRYIDFSGTSKNDTFRRVTVLINIVIEKSIYTVMKKISQFSKPQKVFKIKCNFIGVCILEWIKSSSEMNQGYHCV